MQGASSPPIRQELHALEVMPVDGRLQAKPAIHHYASRCTSHVSSQDLPARHAAGAVQDDSMQARCVSRWNMLISLHLWILYYGTCNSNSLLLPSGELDSSLPNLHNHSTDCLCWGLCR